MLKIISNNNNFVKSINWSNLGKETSFFEFKDEEQIDWGKINHIHILGTQTQEHDIEINDKFEDKFGFYINHDHDWLFAFGANNIQINRIILQTTSILQYLDVRFTEIKEIDLSGKENIKWLCLAHNLNLSYIKGIETLNNFTTFDIKNTQINDVSFLDKCNGLRSLNLRNTKIDKLTFNECKNELRHLDVAYTSINECSFLKKSKNIVTLNLSCTNINNLPSLNNLANLEVVNLSHLNINKVPELSKLDKLRTLKLSYSQINSIENVQLPISLRNLHLAGTKISTLPNQISELVNLRRLDISNTSLNNLPANLLRLNLGFTTDNKYGINIQNTVINGTDSNFLLQPRSILESWFKSQPSLNNDNTESPLNEVKIVFLGDGGAGKSLAIQRLLNDGDFPEDFDGESTPGICISNKNYNVGNKSILVHYWDFGGQEIMHSMHRMFLTKRTLYVVFVNARDNTQDERAYYWLHNIKTFANGSKVILVLNQMDQNPSASVNETALFELYPQLADIIKISAKEMSTNEFNQGIKDIIINRILDIPCVNEPFLPSWKSLKSELQNMQAYYIDSSEYEKICLQCGIINEEERRDLLEWFSDLGVSFCYNGNSVLSNYMVLRPDWITNAIYIILFNGIKISHNGLIKHEDIHAVLKSGDNSTVFKRVINNITYSTIETEYVLGVIRKFRLSYRMDDDTEFIPMLCDRNENLNAKEFYNKEDVLEFYLEYEYLPNNVLHRLMVDMRNYLNTDFVWLTGAIFELKECNNMALVKIEDNKLKIYIKSGNALYPPIFCLNLIKNAVININRNLGLVATETIVYKKNLQKEEFEYEYLMASYNHGNKTVFSKVFKNNIFIEDILNQSDRSVDDKKSKLINDIVDACIKMQSHNLYWNAKEDDRNTFIRDILRAVGYIVSDQTLSGKSSSGKQAGELDLEIREKDRPIAIYEALNTKGFNSTQQKYWEEHLSKLIDNYNPVGLPFMFLVCYLDCSKEDFKKVWLDYSKHVCSFGNENLTLENHIEHESSNFYTRIIECHYNYLGAPISVYNICVRLGE